MSTLRSVVALVVCGAAAAAGARPVEVADLGLLPGDAGVAPATNSQVGHAVARGGDQYLVVWSDYRSQNVGNATNQSAGDIFGVRLGADGTPIDAVPFVVNAAMGEQRNPLVAWNGEAWLVVFESQDPVGGYFETRLRAARVSAGGEVLDATPLVFPPVAFEPSTLGLNVAGLDGQWIVTRCVYHADGYGTFLGGQRVSGAGVLLDASPRMLMDWTYGATRALVANGEYLLVGPTWNDANLFQARRVNAAGTPVGAAFSVPSMNMGTDGSGFYVTWVSGFVNIVGSRMTSTGTLLNPAGTFLFIDPLPSYYHTNVTHDGMNWWVELGAASVLRTFRVNASGQVLDPSGVVLPIVIGGNIDNAYTPRLEALPGGGVLVFWYDHRVALGSDANVFSMEINAANQPGEERCVSSGTASQRSPDFAEGPAGGSALVMVSEFANEDRVLVHLLNAAGQPTTPEPIEVARGATVGNAAIAWNGSVYLVAWDEGASGLTPIMVRTRRMAADGTLLDGAPLDLMAGFDPDVEALGTDFLVASGRFSPNPQFLYAQSRRVEGSTGLPLDASATTLGGGYVSTGPRVRTDGTRWIVVYHSHWSHDDARSDVLYNFVEAGGSYTPARNPATTSGAAGTPDVAFSGSRYLFVWRNNTLANANNFIAGRVMNQDGTFATGNIVIGEAAGRQLGPVAGWDGSSFVVAWDDQRHQQSFFDERTDIYAARVSEVGSVMDPAGFGVVTGPGGDALAAMRCRGDGVSLIASSRFTTTGGFDAYRVGITRLGRPACPADFNADGVADSADFFDFLVAFFAVSGEADFNADGDVDSQDFFAFLTAFFAGC